MNTKEDKDIEDKRLENTRIRKLIMPLLIDQLLVVMVGIVDTLMISKVGEQAVSGVSLVDTINMLAITTFNGLATGGAVICAHCIGKKDNKMLSDVINQLLLAVISFSTVVTGIFLLCNQYILHIIFGNIEQGVMNNATIYFRIVTVSFPFLASYTACCAIFRGMGNTKVPMLVSLLMNAVNICGNALLLYGFHCGVEGVAYPTLASRIIASILMIFLIIKGGYLKRQDIKIRFSRSIQKKILSIGIPGSLELSIFQVGKILVLGMIAKLGTVAITSNAVANTINTFQTLPEDAISLAIVTLVGQSLGAGNYKEARKHTFKLMKIIYISMGVLNIISIIIAPAITIAFHLSAETARTTVHLIRFNALFGITIWPLAFALPNALRGAYDVKYPLAVSMFSMWTFRVLFSWVSVTYFHASIYQLYYCFAIDWVFRAGMFLWRYRGKRWEK